MLYIGSVGLAYSLRTDGNDTKDIDYISTYQEYEDRVYYLTKNKLLLAAYPTSGESFVIKSKKFHSNSNSILIEEYNIAYEGTTNKMILDYCGNNSIPSLEILLMLKMSHRYKKNSPHFLKTMRDIQNLRALGAELKDPKVIEILKLREKETYNYKHPSLMQNKDNFFVKDEGFYVWDHDDIHKAVATLDKPAYLFFKPEDSEVMVSKKMWDLLPEDIKLRAGLEESYVLALERAIVPAPGVLTPKQAFDKALEKVCTSITSGWFREYCWENYDNIQALYDESFVSKFNKAVEENKVKRFATK